MSKAFLYIPTPDDKLTAGLLEKNRIELTIPQHSTSLEIGDRLMVMYARNGDYIGLIPGVIEVQAVNKASGKVTLQPERILSNEVSRQELRQTLDRVMPSGLSPLSENEFEKLLQRMGAPRLSEKALLEYVKRYIKARGFYFDEETIYNYHICLKTRPFVILAGLSGTGKSKLAQLYAEALGSQTDNKRYLRLAVRPSWNDDRFLLGYFNAITGEYLTEPAIDHVIRAEKDRTNLYFLCLDEMNLAHVEHYFSQFLSALEESETANRRIPLLSDRLQDRLEKEGRNAGVEPYVILPPNLLFTGTINVDETTHPLSDKVIDRANTIEFFEIDLTKMPKGPEPLPEKIQISAANWQSFRQEEGDTRYRDIIIDISKRLNKANLGLGFRILKDIELYLANSKDLLDAEKALDLQIKQRILPRVRGNDTENTRTLLEDLLQLTKAGNFKRSHARLEEMKDRLKRDGYTSFWR